MTTLFRHFTMVLLLSAGQLAYSGVSANLYPVVRLPDSTTATLALSDLAKLSGDREERQSIATQALFSKQELVELTTLSKSAVSQRLFEKGIRDVSLLGAEEIVIRAPMSRHNMALYEHTATDFLRAQLQQHGLLDIELSALSRAGREILIVNAQLKPRIEGSVLKQRVCVWVDQIANGEKHASVPLWFEVSAKHQVWALRHDVDKTTVLNHAQLEQRLVDFEPGMGLTVTSGDLHALEAPFRYQSAYPAGTPLRHEMISAVPAVMAGDYIEVESVAGRVVVRSTFLAISDAHIGDRVWLKPKQGDQVISAQVIANRLARVEAGS